MGAVVAITRLDLTASELRKAAQREKDSTAARRMLALALVLEGADRREQRRAAGWIAKLWTGCTVTIRKAWPAFGRASRLVLFRNSPRSRGPNWPRLSKPAPIRRSMGWCAGGGLIYATRLRTLRRSLHERSVGKV